MKIISVSCPNCGGTFSGRLTSKYITCEYCDSRFALEDEEFASLGGVVVDVDEDEFDDEFEGEGNALPMDEFAREACEQFLREADEDSFKSSRKILRGLGISDVDEVLLIHDDTLFKSGKNGFAITTKGFYCRDMGSPSAHFVDWDDLAQGPEPSAEDSYVRIGNKSIVYFTDNDEGMDDLERLCIKLYRHACKVQ